MSLSASLWTTAGSAAGAAAMVALLRCPQRPESDRAACRWLAVTAALWGGAAIAQQRGRRPDRHRCAAHAGRGAVPAGAAAFALGLAGLASPRASGRAGGLAGLLQLRLARAGFARLADGCLLAAALFLLGWSTVLAPTFAERRSRRRDLRHRPDQPAGGPAGAGGRTVAGGSRWLRQALTPWLALLLATAGDFLSVGARVSGSTPGWGAQVAWLAGTCVLGATPAALNRAAAPPGPRPGVRGHPGCRRPTRRSAWPPCGG